MQKRILAVKSRRPYDRPLQQPDYFAEFLAVVRTQRAPATAVSYAAHCRRFELFLGSTNTAVAEAARSHVESWITELQQSGRSPATCRIALSAIRGFYRYLQATGRRPDNPAAAMQSPRVPSRVPRPLSPRDVDRLIAAAATREGPLGLRDRALLELIYGSGLRVSEALSLHVDQLLLRDRLAIVTGKGSRQRLTPLTRHAIIALHAYLVRARPTLDRDGGREVFLSHRGRPLSRQAVHLILRRVADHARIDEPVGAHRLRHSYATHVLEGGADLRTVRDLLGHASVATTAGYTALADWQTQEAYLRARPHARRLGRG